MRSSAAARGLAARLAAMKAIDIKDWFRRMPWRRGNSPVSLAPDYESYLFEQWEHGDFDGYWKQLGIYGEGFYDRYVDAAMVHMSSWYDAYTRTATDNYIGLSKRKRGPVRLIMGPWTHGDRQLTYVGDVDFGPILKALIESACAGLGAGDLGRAPLHRARRPLH